MPTFTLYIPKHPTPIDVEVGVLCFDHIYNSLNLQLRNFHVH